MNNTRRPIRVAIAALLACGTALAACGTDRTDRTGPTATYPPVPTFPVPAELLSSPIAALPSGFGAASWAVDGAFPPPEASTTELHLLVWERACSGGAPASGRISAPVVAFGPTTVTITVGVRPLDVPAGYAVTCPGPPGTPAILRLSEPLRSRDLLDGGCTPPAVRASPELLGPGCSQQ
jgi:hypothetical protein